MATLLLTGTDKQTDKLYDQMTKALDSGCMFRWSTESEKAVKGGYQVTLRNELLQYLPESLLKYEV
jgi:hypothetical protein